MSIDPLKNFSYRVSRINANSPNFSAGFTAVHGLSRKVDVIKYRAGDGGRYSQKLPGLVEFDPITLEQGAFINNYDLWNMAERVYKADSGTSMIGTVAEGLIKENILIALTQAGANNTRIIAKAWEVRNCFVSDFTVGNLDATTSDVLKLTLVLQCDYWIELTDSTIGTTISD